jgi:alkanesulfonate monooxygenase SsuD/methylene tetrahydromethanopterin reductase-like flavin-dependent oxidoreductase (luciferase family)
MLASLVELVQAADSLGYWGITHVEHHAHSEGLEISPDPLLLNVYLGHFTKRLMHGQLGIVIPTHDPVRLAAQIAIAERGVCSSAWRAAIRRVGLTSSDSASG